MSQLDSTSKITILLFRGLEQNLLNPEYSKHRSQLLAEKILKSISSAVYLLSIATFII